MSEVLHNIEPHVGVVGLLEHQQPRNTRGTETLWSAHGNTHVTVHVVQRPSWCFGDVLFTNSHDSPERNRDTVNLAPQLGTSIHQQTVMARHNAFMWYNHRVKTNFFAIRVGDCARIKKEQCQCEKVARFSKQESGSCSTSANDPVDGGWS